MKAYDYDAGLNRKIFLTTGIDLNSPLQRGLKFSNERSNSTGLFEIAELLADRSCSADEFKL